MKKRLISLGLTLALVLGLLPYAVLGAAVTSDVDPGYNTASGTASESALFSTAYVRNKGAGSGGNGTAKNIEVVVNLKSGGEATQLVYAVVMLAKNFDDTYAANVANINNTTYATLSATAVSPNYYAMSARAKGTGGTVTLPLVPASAANASTMQGGGTVANKVMQGSPVTGKYYHEEYVLVVFAHDADGHAERYYIDRFYLDSEGYVCTPSYMIRYNGNVNKGIVDNTYDGSYSAANVPGSQIQRGSFNSADLTAHSAPGSATLSNNTPTRIGYIFQGWTDKADFRFLNPDEDASAAVTAAGGKFWEKGASYAQPSKLYTVYDLYAVWKQVPVAFDKAAASDVTLDGVQYKGVHWSAKTPQVGVAFDTGNITLGTPNSQTAEPQGWKYLKVDVYERDPKTGTDTKVGSTAYYSGSQKNNVANRSATTKYGLTISPVVTNNKHYQWKISGTPTDHSSGNQVYLKISVMDGSNKTEDTIVYWFDEVKKGAQPIPTADVNTGLQSQIKTTGEDGAALENPDGQIFGFYSAGAVLNPDEGYTANKDGTGTMTNWYLNMGMVFEYLPHKIKDEDGVLQEVTDNKGWREVPFPESWYTSLSEADKADLTASMASGATKRIVSEKDAKALKASITASEGEAWPASYGYITFDEGLPVIHGLHEDDVYWVRFRANDQYEVSKEREIAIGGAVSGGGGETPVASGGLAVNLAGGSEEKDPSGYSDLKTAAKNLGAGEELDLNVYDFEPTRDGSAFLGWTLGERDTDGNLILYRADEPETITVTWVDHDGTVIVEAITVKVGDPLPGHPAENPTREGYTFDQWVRSEDGEGNVTFTATYTEVTEPEPEPTPTPTPDPESPAARDGEGDGEVTDPGEGGGEGEEPPPVTPTPPVGTAAIWVDGLTGETILEGTTETEAPKKPFHSCYTAAEEWTEVTGEDGTVTYTISYTRNTKVPMPKDLPASLAAVWQGGSDPDPSDFASIIFYDWDEATVLGSIVVAKGVDATDEVNKFVQTQMSPNSRDYTGNEGDPYFVDDAAFPMTYKKGYSFLNWISFESVEPTSYGERVISNNANNLGSEGDNVAAAASKLIAPEETSDFSNITDSIIVKAAYTTNSECVIGPYAAQRQYTVSPSAYGRYGTTFNLPITLKVERGDVPRPTQPYLRVKMTVSGTTIVSLYKLSGADVEEIQVIPYTTLTGGVSQIAWAVIDSYGLSDMNIAAARSAENTTSITRGNVQSMAFDGGNYNVVKDQERTYMHKAYLAGINNALASYDPNTAITTMTDITPVVLRTVGIPLGGMNINNAKSALYEKWKSINMTNGIVNETIIPLTRADMLEALGTTAQAPDVS